MNGVIYCRVSTKEQVEGTSLESQQEACFKFAAERNISVLRIFVEKGESAKYANRTELAKLIEFCKDKKNATQALIVWKVDRFARNVRDHFWIKEILNRAGVEIFSVTEPFDSQPVGKYLETMLAGAAQFENDIRALRCLGGMQRKIEEGLFPWKPPIGYLSASPFKVKKTQADIPDPERFGPIKEGWRRLLTGSSTKADILRYFRSQGLTTQSGRPISVQMVDKIFSNKYYAGILKNPWTREEIEGKHRSMVKPQEFYQVQNILKRRANSQPHCRLRSDFPLRGLLGCPSCYRPLTGSWSRGRNKKYAYYHCKYKGCDRMGKGLPKDSIETEYMEYLRLLEPKPFLLPRIERRIISLSAKNLEKGKRKEGKLQYRMHKLEGEDGELIRMRRKNLISDPAFLTSYNQLQEEMVSLAAAIGQIRASVPQNPGEVREVLSFLGRIAQEVERMPFEFRCRFQHILFPEQLIAKQFGTAKRSPIFTIIERFSEPNTTGVDPSSETWNRAQDQFLKLSELIQSLQKGENDLESEVPRKEA